MLFPVKSKTLSGGGCTDDVNNAAVIRRTASLDTIYLKGQWPRDCFYMFTSYLQIDKATQTDDLNVDLRKPHRFVEAYGGASTDEKLKLIRHRLQRNTQCVVGRDRISLQSQGAFPGDHTVQLPSASSQTTNTPSTISSPTSKASPVNIPVKPSLVRPPMRSSIEGLNQEIEGLVLKATGLPGALYTDRCEDDKVLKNYTLTTSDYCRNNNRINV